MFLPLAIMIFLLVSFAIAAPTSTSLDSASQPLSKRSVIRCFQNPNHVNLAIPLYADCHKAVQLTFCDSKMFTVPMSFSMDATKGFELPHLYAHGTCKITVGMSSPNGVEMGTIAQIAEAAIEVVTHCVNDEPGLGGVTTTGEDDMIQVIVTGKIAPQQQPVPLYAQCVSP